MLFFELCQVIILCIFYREKIRASRKVQSCAECLCGAGEMDQSLVKLQGKCATISLVKDVPLLGSGLRFCKPTDFFP